MARFGQGRLDGASFRDGDPPPGSSYRSRMATVARRIAAGLLVGTDDSVDGIRVALPELGSRPGRSLNTGLAALSSEIGAAMVTLGDEPPLASAPSWRLVMSRWSGGKALHAGYGGRPGHPVLSKRALFRWLVTSAPTAKPVRLLRRPGSRGSSAATSEIPARSIRLHSECVLGGACMETDPMKELHSEKQNGSAGPRATKDSSRRCSTSDRPPPRPGFRVEASVSARPFRHGGMPSTKWPSRPHIEEKEDEFSR